MKTLSDDDDDDLKPTKKTSGKRAIIRPDRAKSENSQTQDRPLFSTVNWENQKFYKQPAREPSKEDVLAAENETLRARCDLLSKQYLELGTRFFSLVQQNKQLVAELSKQQELVSSFYQEVSSAAAAPANSFAQAFPGDGMDLFDSFGNPSRL